MTDGSQRDELDDLLTALGREAARQRAEDDRWWAEVEKGAPQVGALDEEILRPLSEIEQARVLETVLPAPRVRRWPRPLPRWTLALAAGVMVATTTFGLRTWLAPRPVLPRYTLQTVGGASAARSAREPPAERPRLRPGDRLEIRFRPDEPPEVAPALVAAVAEGGVVRGWEPRLERDPSGAFRFGVEVGAPLSTTPGVRRLIFLVAPPEAVPTDLAWTSGPAPDGAQRWEVRVEVLPAIE